MYGRGTGITDTPPFRGHPNYCFYFALAKQSLSYASLRGNSLATPFSFHFHYMDLLSTALISNWLSFDFPFS